MMIQQASIKLFYVNFLQTLQNSYLSPFGMNVSSQEIGRCDVTRDKKGR